MGTMRVLQRAGPRGFHLLQENPQAQRPTGHLPMGLPEATRKARDSNPPPLHLTLTIYTVHLLDRLDRLGYKRLDSRLRNERNRPKRVELHQAGNCPMRCLTQLSITQRGDEELLGGERTPHITRHPNITHQLHRPNCQDLAIETSHTQKASRSSTTTFRGQTLTHTASSKPSKTMT